MDERHIFSISELNLLIKKMFDSTSFFSNILLRGEISNYKKYPSGHHYFTLKDNEAALKCVMFKREGDKLRFRPENGMNVIAQGRVSVFQRDGVYQLYCTDLLPDGAGALNFAFEQLKTKLQQEGLFDINHKKKLPTYPKKIGIITSPVGAAVRDMIRILRTRFPVSEIIILPVKVQGAEAAAEIAGAIQFANEHAVADLIITGRGGGSLEDLWAFNEEIVARAIYASEIPVISAVGHEPDVTISDFVADARASTPSNAAEIAVPDMREMLRNFEVIRDRITSSIQKKISGLKEKVSALGRTRVMSDPLNIIQERRMSLDYTVCALSAIQNRLLSEKKHKFIGLAAKLDALSPMKVLVRGYTVARNEDGAIVHSVGQVMKSSNINLELYDGIVDCVVEGIEYRGVTNEL